MGRSQAGAPSAWELPGCAEALGLSFGLQPVKPRSCSFGSNKSVRLEAARGGTDWGSSRDPSSEHNSLGRRTRSPGTRPTPWSSCEVVSGSHLGSATLFPPRPPADLPRPHRARTHGRGLQSVQVGCDRSPVSWGRSGWGERGKDPAPALLSLGCSSWSGS